MSILLLVFQSLQKYLRLNVKYHKNIFGCECKIMNYGHQLQMVLSTSVNLNLNAQSMPNALILMGDSEICNRKPEN